MLTAPRKVFMIASAVQGKTSKCGMITKQLGALLPGRIVHAVVKIDWMHCELLLALQCRKEVSHI
jgi:hypothetical protein